MDVFFMTLGIFLTKILIIGGIALFGVWAFNDDKDEFWKVLAFFAIGSLIVSFGLSSYDTALEILKNE